MDFIIYFQAFKDLEFVGDKEKEALKCLQDIDVDGDGKVSYAEFMIRWKI